MSDLDYDSPRKIIIEALEAIIYGWHFNDEDLDIYYRMKLTLENFEYYIESLFIEPKTLNYEISPGVYKSVEINNAFKGSVEVKADEKQMKTILTTHHEMNLNTQLNEALGFKKKNYPAGTHSGEKPTDLTIIDKVHIKWICVDGSVVDGRRESVLNSFSFNVLTVFEIFRNLF